MKKLLITSVAVGMMMAPNLAFGATDGTLGATSTGDVGVRVIVIDTPASEAKITGLQDFDLAHITEFQTPPAVTLNNICVFLSTAATYSLTISSSNLPASNTGKMANGTREVPYTWAFADKDGKSVTTKNGSALAGSNNANCSGGETASLTITPTGPAPEFDVSDLSNQLADILTLVVAPE